MATLNLGNIKFNWKGAYAGGTAYVVDDVVSYSGSSYICKLASTGNLPTNGTYWDQMSSAGTNGTDISTTLTTQGDILYRDGSGLQRLAAGTAGQVLKTGGAGANVSWGTVSSDYVKLVTYDISSAVTGFNLTGWIDSAYKFYIVRGHYKMVNSNDYFNIRLINNSGSTVSSGYAWAARHYYVTPGGSPSSNDHGSGSTSGWQPSSTNSIGTNYHGQVELHLAHDNLTAAEHTGCYWTSMHRENGGQVDGFSAVGWHTDSTAFSGSSAGLNFDRAGSGSFGDGTVTIYGLK